jgi:hypothetical protein
VVEHARVSARRYARCVKCAACGGAAHPATGCQHSETCIVCGPCTEAFWRWVRGHTNRVYRAGAKGDKVAGFVSFYEAAGRR